MDAEFEVHEVDGTSVLSVKGELDFYAAPQLREQLVALSDPPDRVLVVDLDGVDFLDSTGLGILVGGLKRFRSGGGDLVLASIHPRVLKVLEITGLTSVFTIHDTLDTALGA